MDIIAFIIFGILVVIPVAAILIRVGIHPAWALVAFVPVVNIVALNLVAFSKWPFSIEKQSRTGSPSG